MLLTGKSLNDSRDISQHSNEPLILREVTLIKGNHSYQGESLLHPLWIKHQGKELALHLLSLSTEIKLCYLPCQDNESAMLSNNYHSKVTYMTNNISKLFFKI